MSLLDQVVGAVTSKLGGQGNAQNDLVEAALSLINNNAGGLSGLVHAFKDKGLANAAASWISTGKNLPVTPEQIQSVLGNSQIREIAQKLGLSEEAASSQLSHAIVADGRGQAHPRRTNSFRRPAGAGDESAEGQALRIRPRDM